MESASGRLVAGLAVLVAVWIGAYWLYDPRKPGDDSITRLATEGGPLPAARHARQPNPDGAADDRHVPTQLADQLNPPAVVPAKPEPFTVPSPPMGQAPIRPPVDKPEFEMYTVLAGDTFEKIAKRKLGSASLAVAIKQANPMKDPRRLRAGDQIRIPRDPSNVQGKPAASAPSESSETYTVVAGDTLSGIAARLLGSAKHWQLILDANTGTLDSAERLRPGMKLRIPAKPE